MNPTNLMSRSAKCVNRFTIQDLPIDLVELSERDLQRIVGGFADGGCRCGGGGTTTTTTTTTTSSGGTTTTTTTTTSSLSAASGCSC